MIHDLRAGAAAGAVMNAYGAYRRKDRQAAKQIHKHIKHINQIF